MRNYLRIKCNPLDCSPRERWDITHGGWVWISKCYWPTTPISPRWWSPIKPSQGSYAKSCCPSLYNINQYSGDWGVQCQGDMKGGAIQGSEPDLPKQDYEDWITCVQFRFKPRVESSAATENWLFKPKEPGWSPHARQGNRNKVMRGVVYVWPKMNPTCDILIILDFWGSLWVEEWSRGWILLSFHWALSYWPSFIIRGIQTILWA